MIKIDKISKENADELFELIRGYMEVNQIKGYVLDTQKDTNYWYLEKGEPTRMRIKKTLEFFHKATVYPQGTVFNNQSHTHVIVKVDNSKRRCAVYDCNERLQKNCYAYAQFSPYGYVNLYCPVCSRNQMKKWPKHWLSAYDSFVDPNYIKNACNGCPNAAKCITRSIGGI